MKMAEGNEQALCLSNPGKLSVGCARPHGPDLGLPGHTSGACFHSPVRPWRGEYTRSNWTSRLFKRAACGDMGAVGHGGWHHFVSVHRRTRRAARRPCSRLRLSCRVLRVCWLFRVSCGGLVLWRPYERLCNDNSIDSTIAQHRRVCARRDREGAPPYGQAAPVRGVALTANRSRRLLIPIDDIRWSVGVRFPITKSFKSSAVRHVRTFSMIVLAESDLVSLKAQAPQPDHDVHSSAETQACRTSSSSTARQSRTPILRGAGSSHRRWLQGVVRSPARADRDGECG